MTGKVRNTLYIYIALIIMFFLATAVGFYNTELDKRPVLREKLELGEADYIYNFYFSGNPNIEGRPYFGSVDAAITLTAYLDLNSKSSREFINEIYPLLEQEFIDEGKIRFYHKHYLTVEDINEKSDRFIYAQSLLCFNSIKPDSYFKYYMDLFGTNGIEDIPTISEKNGVPAKILDACIKDTKFNELSEDASEIDSFGMLGINPRLYIGMMGTDNTMLDGVPQYTKLKRTIRNYQIELGD